MNLSMFLKNEKNARKIFGQRELKIIEKQLSGVNLTQSEKNRLSRDIRKKFEVINKLSRFEDEFKLKKGQNTKNLIEDAKEIILEDELSKRVQSIILYGSFIENQFTLKSDIDIAVKIRGINLKEATQFRKRISGKVNSKVDVQVYDHLPNKITNKIDAQGKTIYENSRQNQGNRTIHRGIRRNKSDRS